MIPVARIPTGGGPSTDLYVTEVAGYRAQRGRGRPGDVDVRDHHGRILRLPTAAVLIDTNRIDTELGEPCSTI